MLLCGSPFPVSHKLGKGHHEKSLVLKRDTLIEAEVSRVGEGRRKCLLVSLGSAEHTGLPLSGGAMVNEPGGVCTLLD